MLNRFNSKYFYFVDYDELALDAPYVELKNQGRQLIADYYQNKYDLSLSFHPNLINFDKKISHFLKNHTPEKEFRHAFYVGTNSAHMTSIIYFNEAGQQGFLCADSLGSQIGTNVCNNRIINTQGSSKIAAQAIKKATNIPIYLVNDQRQASCNTCDIDAFILARDCCGKIHSSFIIPNLLTHLKNSASLSDGYLEVKLHDTLLKLSQINAFTQHHLSSTGSIIHKAKNETLDQFLQRYGQDKHQFKKPHPSYLRLKRIKMANIIEIQFYVNQLSKILGAEWTPDLKTNYIKAAKNELIRQWPVTLNTARNGLYDFTQQFINTRSISSNKLALLSDTTHSVSLNSEFTTLASKLFQIIKDSTYWENKTLLGFGIAPGIRLMQNYLNTASESVSPQEKFNALRLIAQEQLAQKSIFYLFTSQTLKTRHPSVQACYSFFIEDLQASPSLNYLVDDWAQFQRSKTNKLSAPTFLPSMELYKRSRVRF